MMLEVLPHRRIETVDRRVLGALQLVDAVTALPTGVPARIELRAATIADAAIDVARHEHTVRLQQNRSGLIVIAGAPFFDAYASAFDNPVAPPQTTPNPLRLRFGLIDAGSSYLPREFVVDLPRALDPAAPNSIFQPVRVAVFRAPNAAVQPGWALLRVRVTSAAGNPPPPLPGVLIRVFRSPRGGQDAPIGAGMTDWRGRAAGEALVAIADIPRFRPGAGQNVVDTDQAIEFDASRHTTFTGASEQLPDVAALVAGTGAGLIHPPDHPNGSQLQIVQPTIAPPMRVQAGREYVVHLAMP